MHEAVASPRRRDATLRYATRRYATRRYTSHRDVRHSRPFVSPFCLPGGISVSQSSRRIWSTSDVLREDMRFEEECRRDWQDRKDRVTVTGFVRQRETEILRVRLSSPTNSPFDLCARRRVIVQFSSGGATGRYKIPLVIPRDGLGVILSRNSFNERRSFDCYLACLVDATTNVAGAGV